MPAVAMIVVASNGLSKPGDEANVGSAGGRAFLAAGASRTSPIVLRGVDAAGADGGVVKRTHVCNANFAPQQVVQMGVDLGRSVHGDVHVLIADQVAGDDSTDDRRAAVTAIDVDAHGPRRGRVGLVGKVSSDVVADDHVAAHIVRGSAKSGTYVGVQSDTAQAVASQFVVDDDVIGGSARAVAIGKKPDSRASNLHPVVSRDVVAHGVVVHAVVGREIRRARAGGWMRGQNDAAFQRVVPDDIVREQIVAAFGGLVANQDAVGIAGNIVPGHDRAPRANQVKCPPAVAVFIVLVHAAAGLAGTSRWCAGE